jgi:alpha-beta hydrolase superfamily lysophospholipase
MKGWRVTAIGVLVAGMMIALGSNPGMAAPRAHVYLLRGLLNIFSLGMDTLADELNRRGVYATVDNHADWESLANSAAANYKAGKEGPIIIIGHSLGADAAMEMANYLGARGVPVALVVPFDGTQSLSAGPGVARVLNLTQRDYAYMRRGPGFSGSLVNVDLSSDPNIDHLNIDKSPRLHARVIGEVLGVVGSHRTTAPPGPALTPVSAPAPSGTPGGPTAAPAGDGAAKPDVVPATPAAPIAPAAPAPPVKSGDGAMNAMKPLADSGTPIIALPERAPASPVRPAN